MVQSLLVSSLCLDHLGQKEVTRQSPRTYHKGSVPSVRPEVLPGTRWVSVPKAGLKWYRLRIQNSTSSEIKLFCSFLTSICRTVSCFPIGSYVKIVGKEYYVMISLTSLLCLLPDSVRCYPEPLPPSHQKQAPGVWPPQEPDHSDTAVGVAETSPWQWAIT